MSNVNRAEPTSSQQNANVSHIDRLLNLHIAEYNALTTRNNYWITIQVSTVAIIFGCLAFAGPIVAQAVPEKRGPLLWVSGAAIQCVSMMNYFALQEIYRNVHYIETTLRDLIQNIIASNQPFWLYEQYLKKSTRQAGLTDIAMAVVVVIALATLSIVRWSYRPEMYWGLALNLPLSTVIVLQTHSVIKLRQQFSAPKVNATAKRDVHPPKEIQKLP